MFIIGVNRCSLTGPCVDGIDDLGGPIRCSYQLLRGRLTA